jgi:hypothetical protein
MAANVQSKPVTTSAIVVNVDDVNGNVTYCGFSLRENAGTPAAAVVRIREGGATGTILDTISFAASGSWRECYDDGLACNGDLYFELVSGSVEGSVRYA